MTTKTKNNWLEIDRDGLRKSLAQKDKFFLLTEMVANAWDAGVTRVEVTLTRPENGVTRLTVADDSATGWSRLSDSYTMFAESIRKDDPTKRGRFNAGCKDVLASALEARLTTMTGEMIFDRDGHRSEGTATRARGSEFTGLFEMSEAEWLSVCKQARLFIPPTGIATIFNGEEIKQRTPVGSFTDTLPSRLADKEGMLRPTERKTDVQLYDTLAGEQAMIFELGVPIVELGDDKWHVNVKQKVPVSRDRDNVNPSYIRKIRVGVLNAKFAELKGEEAATAGWVRDAMGSENSSDAAVKHIVTERFGDKAVTRSVSDIGSKNEAVSKGFAVIEGGSMSKEEWTRVKAIRQEDGTALIPSSHDVAPTDLKVGLNKSLIIPKSKWSGAMKDYAALVETLAPKMIDIPVSIRFIDNEDNCIQGCFHTAELRAQTKGKTQYDREWGFMTVNLAYHDIDSMNDNYELLLHEFAHQTVKSNDHLCHEFYETVTILGGKLTILMEAQRQRRPRTIRQSELPTEYAVAVGAAKRK